MNEEKQRITKIKNEQAKMTYALQSLQNQKAQLDQMRGQEKTAKYKSMTTKFETETQQF